MVPYLIVPLTAGTAGAALGVLTVFVDVASRMPDGGYARQRGARKE